MSWYRNLVVLLLFTTSCIAQKTINSDLIYIKAVDCELRKKYECSSLNYALMYDLSKAEAFLKLSISYSLMVKDFTIIEKNLSLLKQKAPTDMDYSRFLIPYYINQGDYVKAKNLADTNLKKDNSKQNQKIAKAFKNINPIEKSVEDLKKLYYQSKNIIYVKEIAKIYIKTKQEDKLKLFLEESRSYDPLLMDVYANLQEYKNAENMAMELYKKTKEPMYLIKAAVYLYEPNESKFSAKQNNYELNQVVDRFEKSVFKIGSSMYYNYYGYILIDHDIAVKRGIELIEMALAIEPYNSYFIDSLAWGYYKNAECQKAFDILSPLKDDMQEDIQNHLKKIKQCLENK